MSILWLKVDILRRGIWLTAGIDFRGNDAGFWSDDDIKSWSEVTTYAHSQNQKIGIQLVHAGIKGIVEAFRKLGAIRAIKAATFDVTEIHNAHGCNALGHSGKRYAFVFKLEESAPDELSWRVKDTKIDVFGSAAQSMFTKQFRRRRVDPFGGQSRRPQRDAEKNREQKDTR
ncbi:hypothetical protein MPER_12202 [Moniliophthora perniciosa FA553]|nr:hypothetical protein MPER_12202 [Moniliophthora perniciosa FA553]